MRVMMLMIPGITEDKWMPSAKDFAAMNKFNQDMVKAGVMLTGEGLHPPSEGARISFSASGPKITDGPFTEAKEVVGGYWLIETKSKAEAVEWARRCPASPGDVIEIRQIFEMSEFPDDLKRAAGH